MWSNKLKGEYYPFVTTQLYEEQNHFLLLNDFIRSNFSQFNQILYNFLDQGFPGVSFFRIFRIEEKVALVYYWKSNKTEPKSDRKGIYLIIGILCDYSVFQNKPLSLLFALNCLIDMIIKEHQSYDCTEIIRKIWERQVLNYSQTHEMPRIEEVHSNCSLVKRRFDYQSNEDVFGHISDSFPSICLRYIQSNNSWKYLKKLRFGACHLYLCVPSNSTLDIPLFFVSEAANWMCHYWGKTDIASLDGYGRCFINVRLNDQGVPSKMKRVKLLKRFNKTYLEIQVE